MHPKVIIILLNWNNFSDTEECLNSLLNISYPNYEIIVVDNGSEDDSLLKLINKFHDKVEFIKNKRNLGFSEGNNVGINYALRKNVEYILLLNNDTVVDRNFLDELIKYSEAESSIGIVGPKIYYYKEPEVIWFSGGNFNKFKGSIVDKEICRIDNNTYDNIKEVDFITGCTLLIKSEVLEKICLLDKEYFNYAEDADFCLRAKREGYKVVFVPSSKVWHKVARSMKGNFSPFYLYFQSKNRLLLVKKNFSKIYLIYAVFIHIFCYIPYKLLIILLKKEKKLKASLSLFLGTYDFLVGNKKSRFF